MAPRNAKKRKQTPSGFSSSSQEPKALKIKERSKGAAEVEGQCHPTAEECRSVRDALLNLHGFPKEFAPYRRQRCRDRHLREEEEDESQYSRRDDDDGNGDDVGSVLDGLMSTLLSQNTTDANSRRAFRSLKSALPTWEQVLDADTKSVENAIRCGGLAATKAARIKSILNGIRERRGQLCLEYLRALPVDEVKAELSHFKGIGPKTVACVLMFQLQRDDFPVDTHVFRITKAMGWVPPEADREKAYIHLNKRIPDELKFDLNCLLVTHGKVCERCVKKQGNVQIRGLHTSCPLDYFNAVLPDRE